MYNIVYLTPNNISRYNIVSYLHMKILEIYKSNYVIIICYYRYPTETYSPIAAIVVSKSEQKRNSRIMI